MIHPTSGDSFLQWDPAQVSNYMSQFDRSVGELFLDHKLDGSLLPYLTTDHLKEIGIEKLALRLEIKKAITDLIQNYNSKDGIHQDLVSKGANVNNNSIHIQSLALAITLLKEGYKKCCEHKLAHKQSTSTLKLNSTPSSPTQQELKKLNDSLNKLKADISPALRLIKESKPLPTPTLDPGSTIGKSLDSPTFSISSATSTEKDHLHSHHHTSNGTQSNSDKSIMTNTRRNSIINGNNSIPNSQTTNYKNSNNSIPSPTFSSNRFSSGSLLSMGTGKVIQQSVVHGENSRSNFTLQKINKRSPVSQMPRLVTTNSHGGNSSSTLALNSGNGGGSSGGPSPSTSLNPSLPSSVKPSIIPHATSVSSSSTATTTTVHGHSNNEPLKQLRASSDDSCLKVLQQAMKRHGIPRDDWSKYVLVICYGDKERILKLDEKPVIIFKELQELGKHPAIMLRQLAISNGEDDDSQYEDSRIGEDIPGGTL